MPFDLPEYDRAFAVFLHDLVDGLARARDPVLAMIGVETTTSSVASRIRHRDGIDVDLPEELVGFSLAVPRDAVLKGDLGQFAAEVDNASEELSKRLATMMFSTLDKVTEATGNVVDAGGKLTFDTFYEMLDTLEWDLTDEGELAVPSLVLHPDTVKHLPSETPETRERIEQLKQRKYEEALARRGSRRLS